jgi:hypothetical protein
MKILLIGFEPAMAWVSGFIERAFAAAKVPLKPQVVVVRAEATRELLASLLAEPIDALILPNHAPFAAGPPAAVSPDAVRAEAQRAVLAIELARKAINTLVLEQREAGNWPALLARLLGELVIHGLPDVAGWPGWPEAGELPAAPAITPLLSPYLRPLFTGRRQGAPLKIAWPRESFLYGDTPGEMLPPTIELAGRARIVAYGPYLPLPSGNWHATAFLGFSPDIGKMPFIFEADTGGAVTRGFFEVENGGIFTLKLDFRVVDPMHPVEMRLISQDSALEGQLSLIEVELELAS